MQQSILIASPDLAFGEFIRQTIADSEQYQAVLVERVDMVVKTFAEEDFSLALLDADFPPAELAFVSQALQEINAAVPQALLLPDSIAQPESLAQIETLSKPFYTPDLFALLQRLTSGAPAAAPVGSSAAPRVDNSPWLEDVQRAAQHLTRLSLATAAQAALIVRAGELWAYAGQLSQAAALELAQTAQLGWRSSPNSAPALDADLARFVHLQTTGDDYMLYATQLAEALTLALAFETTTPFSQMRAQATELARSLAEPPSVDLPAAGFPSARQLPEPAFSVAPLLNQETEASYQEPDLDLPALPLFEPGFVPPPSPGAASEWIPEDERWDEGYNPFNVPIASEPRPETKLAEPPQHAGGQPYAEEYTEAPTEAHIRPFVELDSPTSRYYLRYTFVLTPRLPNHTLVDELRSRLPAWLEEICLAYEWQLERHMIRPDYLLWSSRLPPETAPRAHEQIVRELLSERIFSAFPQLAYENPSGDFWSAGSLILSLAEPLPEDLLADFIAHNRRRLH